MRLDKYEQEGVSVVYAVCEGAVHECWLIEVSGLAVFCF
jgi:hypothetical protein